MICVEEIRAHSFKMTIATVFSLCYSEVSQSMNLRQIARELNLPVIIGKVNEEILLSTQQSLSEHHLPNRKLPLLSEFVAHQEIGAVFCGVVQSPGVITVRVYFGEVF